TWLADSGAVFAPVRDVLDRAVRSWPPLARAESAPGGPDLLLTTDLLLELVDEGVEVLRGRGIEVLLPRAWTRVRTVVRATVVDPGTEDRKSTRLNSSHVSIS